jgi:3-dehydroquinate synthase
VRTLQIRGTSKASSVVVGERLENLDRYVPGGIHVIVTDTNVFDHYRQAFPAADRILIGMGEQVKTLETVQRLYADFLAFGVQRSSVIVGIGGGIVCDITGFAASTYLRGVRFGFVATTLLAQVDASVGGKNGVNFMGYKNMIGLFSQPEFVICDPQLLKTLPTDEVLSGLGEIVKHAAIDSPALFEYLQAHASDLITLDPVAIEQVVFDSVSIKARIVNRDELETGERRKLNFGHTVGHAIEKASGLAHGKAIAAGMLLAAKISQRRGLISRKAVNRFKRLLETLHLPTTCTIEPSLLMDAIKKDKKREENSIHFVFLEAIGKAVVAEIGLDELESHLQEIFNSPW